MTRAALLLLAMMLVVTAACGIRRPLIKPKDVPAYEANRAKRLQQMQEEEAPAQNENNAATPAQQPTPSQPSPEPAAAGEQPGAPGASVGGAASGGL